MTKASPAIALLSIFGISGLVAAQGPGGSVPNERCCTWGQNNSCVIGWELNQCKLGPEGAYWKLVERNDFPWCVASEDSESNCTDHQDVCGRFEIYEDSNCTILIATQTSTRGHCDAGSDGCS